jgi:hypothetical protein
VDCLFGSVGICGHFVVCLGDGGGSLTADFLFGEMVKKSLPQRLLLARSSK